ncbi:MAG: hypothetical protein JWM44_2312 [Bacilli bacterium]|nr:hypothetical protein [Bacilli bacterium]
MEEIKKRIANMSELEKQLMTAGPARAETIIKKQSEIQEYYVADVCELIETMENAIYELKKLESLLEMPEKGYVRNNFNRIVKNLEEGF